uniref:Uncharacterized protein n=1 Tax=Schistocephalus solidus TaxID=70667 RepID=A0A0V0J9M2_SCHSO
MLCHTLRTPERTGPGVGIAHRHKATMRSRMMKIKDQLNFKEQSGVSYRIPCLNCPCNYTGQNEHMLVSCICQHNLAVRWGDELPQVTVHTYETDHKFNFAAVKRITHAGNKAIGELIEAWLADGTQAIGVSIWCRRTKPCAVTSRLASVIIYWHAPL